LLQPREDGRWDALVRPSARMKPGHRMRIAPDVHVVIEDATDDGTRVVRLDAPMSVDQLLERYGHIPLPPYITRGDEPSDAERYQTVYAAEAGSVAAPTAGLHFTPQIIETLRARGVGWETVLLHVGAGTFKPVDVEDPADHVMHQERYTLSPETAAALTATRARGGAVWAVGTTSLRVLESTVDASGAFQARGGTTDIFIRPPHTMRGADHLITNFHLPKSTLLMLVAAVAGYELTMDAYATAVAAGYRFYSYGDAMCIV
jgi:S-adenosylmethionine:tRNA ribosyltransferase-isomerase